MKLPLQLALLTILPFVAVSSLAQTSLRTSDDPVPGLVRLKLKAGSSIAPEDVRSLLERSLPGHRVAQVSPWIRPELLTVPPEALLRPSLIESADRPQAFSGLRRIVLVRFAGDHDIPSLARQIERIAEIEYAEPVWRRRLATPPNDILLSEQLYLTQLHASEAWEVARADATIVIAVIDSGIDPLHPDLADALWQNSGETGADWQGKNRSTNGIDDDNNGLVDDHWGYDFAGREGKSQDNYPGATFSHGVHVAGIAAATGNNGHGVAGVGYGARIMPLKVTADTALVDPDLIRPYEAILYAGRMGAHIINCSWGGYQKSKAEQEIIDNVTAMGSLVIAAAGNQGQGIAVYPAAYRHVVSVGSVNSDDRRSLFSNYHETVDLVAPGENVLSTIPVEDGSYGTLSGTSMAAPMVSGAAALILSQYGPNALTPQQLAAILKSSTDAIDDINPQYRTRMGTGRLNVQRSITLGLNGVYAEVIDVGTDDAGEDGYLDAGEEFDLKIVLQNVLAAEQNLIVEATVLDTEALDAIDATFSFPPLASGETADNDSAPFRFRIGVGTVYDRIVPLLLTVRAGDRVITTSRYDLVVNPSYGTTTTSRLAATFGGNGRIGFIDFPNNRLGEGFRVDGSSSMLAEGGLIIGTDPEHVIGALGRDATIGQEGLLISSPFRVSREDAKELEVGTARFNDGNLTPATRIGLDISLETRAYSTPDRENQILLLYTLRNISGRSLEDLHCALFLDWDVGVRGKENRTSFDPINRMGYTEHATDDGQPLVGAMLVSDGSMSFTALDNQQAPLSDGFTAEERWWIISQGIGVDRSEIGDNVMILGAGPVSLAEGDSTVVAFALLTGDDPVDLGDGAESMRALYREIGGTPGGPITVIRDALFFPSQPNPFRDGTVIRYGVPEERDVRLDIFDIDGRHVTTLVDQVQRQGIHEVRFDPPWDRGTSVWVVRLTSGLEILTEKLIYLGN